MATLLYSPGIRVVIETVSEGIIDVSDDIERGSLTLTENAPSSLSLALINHRRKYDGIFTPNDLVSVQMKRVRWLPVFAGYLDEVPYFSVYPRNVSLKATDTLKRLKYRLWDPGTEKAVNLLYTGAGPHGGRGEIDGGLRDRTIKLLTEVAQWPKHAIHIGGLPSDWSARMEPLRQKLAEQTEIDPSILGPSGAVSGTNSTSAGSSVVPSGGAGTGVLPTARGKAKIFAGPHGAYRGPFQLTGESGGTPRDSYYIAMRWAYGNPDSQTGTPVPGMTTTQYNQAKEWWKNRKILVVNPKNDRAVVLRAVHWGPWKNTGYDIGISRWSLEEKLGAKQGDSLEVRFAPSDAKLGPMTVAEGQAAAGGSTPPTTTPQVVSGASGLRFTSADSLKPNTHAARQFVKANWEMRHGIGGYVYRTIAGTNTLSDHAKGLALDFMVCPGGQRATGADEAKGNAIAMWFAQNPHVFGVKYIIWMDRINTGSGWRAYGHPGGSGNTLQHRDHVHVSFKDTGQTSPGAMGSSWPGGTPGDFGNNVTAGSGASATGSGATPMSQTLINAFNWIPTADPFSEMLAGPRALMNDVPILGTVAVLCQSSMRSFMAAPNGDFIAWFPDYFGTYGTAAKMNIRDIELAGNGFTITWNDERLVTHQFTAGSADAHSTAQVGNPIQGVVDIYRQMQTGGIATVEFPELMEALFNVNRNDPRAKNFLDPQAILQRFGARVSYKGMGSLIGKEAEFWYACHLFQRNWAAQFSSQVDLTFMPEVWPGMLLNLETFGFQAYVESVTHDFSFTDGGGFDTSVRVIAPSTTEAGGFYALPRANNMVVPQSNRGPNTYGWSGDIDRRYRLKGLE